MASSRKSARDSLQSTSTSSKLRHAVAKSVKSKAKSAHRKKKTASGKKLVPVPVRPSEEKSSRDSKRELKNISSRDSVKGAAEKSINCVTEKSINCVTNPSYTNKTTTTRYESANFPLDLSDCLQDASVWEAMEIRFLENDTCTVLRPKLCTSASTGEDRSQKTSLLDTKRTELVTKNGDLTKVKGQIRRQTVCVEKVHVKNLLNTKREKCGNLSSSRLSEYRPPNVYSAMDTCTNAEVKMGYRAGGEYRSEEYFTDTETFETVYESDKPSLIYGRTSDSKSGAETKSTTNDMRSTVHEKLSKLNRTKARSNNISQVSRSDQHTGKVEVAVQSCLLSDEESEVEEINTVDECCSAARRESLKLNEAKTLVGPKRKVKETCYRAKGSYINPSQTVAIKKSASAGGQQVETSQSISVKNPHVDYQARLKWPNVECKVFVKETSVDNTKASSTECLKESSAEFTGDSSAELVEESSADLATGSSAERDGDFSGGSERDSSIIEKRLPPDKEDFQNIFLSNYKSPTTYARDVGENWEFSSKHSSAQSSNSVKNCSRQNNVLSTCSNAKYRHGSKSNQLSDDYRELSHRNKTGVIRLKTHPANTACRSEHSKLKQSGSNETVHVHDSPGITESTTGSGSDWSRRSDSRGLEKCSRKLDMPKDCGPRFSPLSEAEIARYKEIALQILIQRKKGEAYKAMTKRTDDSSTASVSKKKHTSTRKRVTRPETKSDVKSDGIKSETKSVKTDKSDGFQQASVETARVNYNDHSVVSASRRIRNQIEKHKKRLQQAKEITLDKEKSEGEPQSKMKKKRQPKNTALHNKADKSEVFKRAATSKHRITITKDTVSAITSDTSSVFSWNQGYAGCINPGQKIAVTSQTLGHSRTDDAKSGHEVKSNTTTTLSITKSDCRCVKSSDDLTHGSSKTVDTTNKAGHYKTGVITELRRNQRGDQVRSVPICHSVNSSILPSQTLAKKTTEPLQQTNPNFKSPGLLSRPLQSLDVPKDYGYVKDLAIQANMGRDEYVATLKDDDTRSTQGSLMAKRPIKYFELLQNILKSPTARATQALGMFLQKPDALASAERELDITVDQIINSYQEIFDELNTVSATVAKTAPGQTHFDMQAKMGSQHQMNNQARKDIQQTLDKSRKDTEQIRDFLDGDFEKHRSSNSAVLEKTIKSPSPALVGYQKSDKKVLLSPKVAPSLSGRTIEDTIKKSGESATFLKYDTEKAVTPEDMKMIKPPARPPKFDSYLPTKISCKTARQHFCSLMGESSMGKKDLPRYQLPTKSSNGKVLASLSSSSVHQRRPSSVTESQGALAWNTKNLKSKVKKSDGSGLSQVIGQRKFTRASSLSATRVVTTKSSGGNSPHSVPERVTAVTETDRSPGSHYVPHRVTAGTEADRSPGSCKMSPRHSPILKPSKETPAKTSQHYRMGRKESSPGSAKPHSDHTNMHKLFQSIQQRFQPSRSGRSGSRRAHSGITIVAPPLSLNISPVTPGLQGPVGGWDDSQTNSDEAEKLSPAKKSRSDLLVTRKSFSGVSTTDMRKRVQTENKGLTATTTTKLEDFVAKLESSSNLRAVSTAQRASKTDQHKDKANVKSGAMETKITKLTKQTGSTVRRPLPMPKYNRHTAPENKAVPVKGDLPTTHISTHDGHVNLEVKKPEFVNPSSSGRNASLRQRNPRMRYSSTERLESGFGKPLQSEKQLTGMENKRPIIELTSGEKHPQRVNLFSTVHKPALTGSSAVKEAMIRSRNGQTVGSLSEPVLYKVHKTQSDSKHNLGTQPLVPSAERRSASLAFKKSPHRLKTSTSQSSSVRMVKSSDPIHRPAKKSVSTSAILTTNKRPKTPTLKSRVEMKPEWKPPQRRTGQQSATRSSKKNTPEKSQIISAVKDLEGVTTSEGINTSEGIDSSGGINMSRSWSRLHMIRKRGTSLTTAVTRAPRLATEARSRKATIDPSNVLKRRSRSDEYVGLPLGAKNKAWPQKKKKMETKEVVPSIVISLSSSSELSDKEDPESRYGTVCNNVTFDLKGLRPDLTLDDIVSQNNDESRSKEEDGAKSGIEMAHNVQGVKAKSPPTPPIAARSPPTLLRTVHNNRMSLDGHNYKSTGPEQMLLKKIQAAYGKTQHASDEESENSDLLSFQTLRKRAVAKTCEMIINESKHITCSKDLPSTMDLVGSDSLLEISSPERTNSPDKTMDGKALVSNDPLKSPDGKSSATRGLKAVVMPLDASHVIGQSPVPKQRTTLIYALDQNSKGVSPDVGLETVLSKARNDDSAKIIGVSHIKTSPNSTDLTTNELQNCKIKNATVTAKVISPPLTGVLRSPKKRGQGFRGQAKSGIDHIAMCSALSEQVLSSDNTFKDELSQHAISLQEDEQRFYLDDTEYMQMPKSRSSLRPEALNISPTIIMPVHEVFKSPPHIALVNSNTGKQNSLLPDQHLTWESAEMEMKSQKPVMTKELLGLDIELIETNSNERGFQSYTVGPETATWVHTRRSHADQLLDDVEDLHHRRNFGHDDSVVKSEKFVTDFLDESRPNDDTEDIDHRRDSSSDKNAECISSKVHNDQDSSSTTETSSNSEMFKISHRARESLHSADDWQILSADKGQVLSADKGQLFSADKGQDFATMIKVHSHKKVIRSPPHKHTHPQDVNIHTPKSAEKEFYEDGEGTQQVTVLQSFAVGKATNGASLQVSDEQFKGTDNHQMVLCGESTDEQSSGVEFKQVECCNTATLESTSTKHVDISVTGEITTRHLAQIQADLTERENSQSKNVLEAELRYQATSESSKGSNRVDDNNETSGILIASRSYSEIIITPNQIQTNCVTVSSKETIKSEAFKSSQLDSINTKADFASIWSEPKTYKTESLNQDNSEGRSFGLVPDKAIAPECSSQMFPMCNTPPSCTNNPNTQELIPSQNYMPNTQELIPSQNYKPGEDHLKQNKCERLDNNDQYSSGGETPNHKGSSEMDAEACKDNGNRLVADPTDARPNTHAQMGAMFDSYLTPMATPDKQAFHQQQELGMRIHIALEEIVGCQWKPFSGHTGTYNVAIDNFICGRVDGVHLNANLVNVGGSGSHHSGTNENTKTKGQLNYNGKGSGSDKDNASGNDKGSGNDNGSGKDYGSSKDNGRLNDNGSGKGNAIVNDNGSGQDNNRVNDNGSGEDKGRVNDIVAGVKGDMMGPDEISQGIEPTQLITREHTFTKFQVRDGSKYQPEGGARNSDICYPKTGTGARLRALSMDDCGATVMSRSSNKRIARADGFFDCLQVKPEVCILVDIQTEANRAVTTSNGGDDKHIRQSNIAPDSSTRTEENLKTVVNAIDVANQDNLKSSKSKKMNDKNQYWATRDDTYSDRSPGGTEATNSRKPDSQRYASIVRAERNKSTELDGLIMKNIEKVREINHCCKMENMAERTRTPEDSREAGGTRNQLEQEEDNKATEIITSYQGVGRQDFEKPGFLTRSLSVTRALVSNCDQLSPSSEEGDGHRPTFTRGPSTDVGTNVNSSGSTSPPLSDEEPQVRVNLNPVRVLTRSGPINYKYIQQKALENLESFLKTATRRRGDTVSSPPKAKSRQDCARMHRSCPGCTTKPPALQALRNLISGGDSGSCANSYMAINEPCEKSEHIGRLSSLLPDETPVDDDLIIAYDMSPLLFGKTDEESDLIGPHTQFSLINIQQESRDVPAELGGILDYGPYYGEPKLAEDKVYSDTVKDTPFPFLTRELVAHDSRPDESVQHMMRVFSGQGVRKNAAAVAKDIDHIETHLVKSPLPNYLFVRESEQSRSNQEGRHLSFCSFPGSADDSSHCDLCELFTLKDDRNQSLPTHRGFWTSDLQQQFGQKYNLLPTKSIYSSPTTQKNIFSLSTHTNTSATLNPCVCQAAAMFAPGASYHTGGPSYPTGGPSYPTGGPSYPAGGAGPFKNNNPFITHAIRNPFITRFETLLVSSPSDSENTVMPACTAAGIPRTHNQQLHPGNPICSHSTVYNPRDAARPRVDIPEVRPVEPFQEPAGFVLTSEELKSFFGCDSVESSKRSDQNDSSQKTQSCSPDTTKEQLILFSEDPIAGRQQTTNGSQLQTHPSDGPSFSDKLFDESDVLLSRFHFETEPVWGPGCLTGENLLPLEKINPESLTSLETPKCSQSCLGCCGKVSGHYTQLETRDEQPWGSHFEMTMSPLERSSENFNYTSLSVSTTSEKQLVKLCSNIDLSSLETFSLTKPPGVDSSKVSLMETTSSATSFSQDDTEHSSWTLDDQPSISFGSDAPLLPKCGRVKSILKLTPAASKTRSSTDCDSEDSENNNHSFSENVEQEFLDSVTFLTSRFLSFFMGIETEVKKKYASRKKARKPKKLCKQRRCASNIYRHQGKDPFELKQLNQTGGHWSKKFSSLKFKRRRKGKLNKKCDLEADSLSSSESTHVSRESLSVTCTDLDMDEKMAPGKNEGKTRNTCSDVLVSMEAQSPGTDTLLEQGSEETLSSGPKSRCKDVHMSSSWNDLHLGSMNNVIRMFMDRPSSHHQCCHHENTSSRRLFAEMDKDGNVIPEDHVFIRDDPPEPISSVFMYNSLFAEEPLYPSLDSLIHTVYEDEEDAGERAPDTDLNCVFNQPHLMGEAAMGQTGGNGYPEVYDCSYCFRLGHEFPLDIYPGLMPNRSSKTAWFSSPTQLQTLFIILGEDEAGGGSEFLDDDGDDPETGLHEALTLQKAKDASESIQVIQTRGARALEQEMILKRWEGALAESPTEKANEDVQEQEATRAVSFTEARDVVYQTKIYEQDYDGEIHEVVFLTKDLGESVAEEPKPAPQVSCRIGCQPRKRKFSPRNGTDDNCGRFYHYRVIKEDDHVPPLKRKKIGLTKQHSDAHPSNGPQHPRRAKFGGADQRVEFSEQKSPTKKPSPRVSPACKTLRSSNEGHGRARFNRDTESTCKLNTFRKTNLNAGKNLCKKRSPLARPTGTLTRTYSFVGHEERFNHTNVDSTIMSEMQTEFNEDKFTRSYHEKKVKTKLENQFLLDDYELDTYEELGSLFTEMQESSSSNVFHDDVRAAEMSESQIFSDISMTSTSSQVSSEASSSRESLPRLRITPTVSAGTQTLFTVHKYFSNATCCNETYDGRTLEGQNTNSSGGEDLKRGRRVKVKSRLWRHRCTHQADGSRPETGDVLSLRPLVTTCFTQTETSTGKVTDLSFVRNEGQGFPNIRDLMTKCVHSSSFRCYVQNIVDERMTTKLHNVNFDKLDQRKGSASAVGTTNAGALPDNRVTSKCSLRCVSADNDYDMPTPVCNVSDENIDDDIEVMTAQIEKASQTTSMHGLVIGVSATRFHELKSCKHSPDVGHTAAKSLEITQSNTKEEGGQRVAEPEKSNDFSVGKYKSAPLGVRSLSRGKENAHLKSSSSVVIPTSDSVIHRTGKQVTSNRKLLASLSHTCTVNKEHPGQLASELRVSPKETDMNDNPGIPITENERSPREVSVQVVTKTDTETQYDPELVSANKNVSDKAIELDENLGTAPKKSCSASNSSESSGSLSGTSVDYGRLKNVLSTETKMLWKSLTRLEKNSDHCRTCRLQYMSMLSPTIKSGESSCKDCHEAERNAAKTGADNKEAKAKKRTSWRYWPECGASNTTAKQQNQNDKPVNDRATSRRPSPSDVQQKSEQCHKPSKGGDKISPHRFRSFQTECSTRVDISRKIRAGSVRGRHLARMVNLFEKGSGFRQDDSKYETFSSDATCNDRRQGLQESLDFNGTSSVSDNDAAAKSAMPYTPSANSAGDVEGGIMNISSLGVQDKGNKDGISGKGFNKNCFEASGWDKVTPAQDTLNLKKCKYDTVLLGVSSEHKANNDFFLQNRDQQHISPDKLKADPSSEQGTPTRKSCDSADVWIERLVNILHEMHQAFPHTANQGSPSLNHNSAVAQQSVIPMQQSRETDGVPIATFEFPVAEGMSLATYVQGAHLMRTSYNTPQYLGRLNEIKDTGLSSTDTIQKLISSNTQTDDLVATSDDSQGTNVRSCPFNGTPRRMTLENHLAEKGHGHARGFYVDTNGPSNQSSTQTVGQSSSLVDSMVRELIGEHNQDGRDGRAEQIKPTTGVFRQMGDHYMNICGNRASDTHQDISHKDISHQDISHQDTSNVDGVDFVQSENVNTKRSSPLKCCASQNQQELKLFKCDTVYTQDHFVTSSRSTVFSRPHEFDAKREAATLKVNPRGSKDDGATLKMYPRGGRDEDSETDRSFQTLCATSDLMDTAWRVPSSLSVTTDHHLKEDIIFSNSRGGMKNVSSRVQRLQIADFKLTKVPVSTRKFRLRRSQSMAEFGRITHLNKSFNAPLFSEDAREKTTLYEFPATSSARSGHCDEMTTRKTGKSKRDIFGGKSPKDNPCRSWHGGVWSGGVWSAQNDKMAAWGAHSDRLSVWSIENSLQCILGRLLSPAGAVLVNNNFNRLVTNPSMDNRSNADNTLPDNKGTAHNLSSESKSTAHNLSSESKSTAHNLSSESKSTAHNMRSESKSTAHNMSSESKSTVTNMISENKSTATHLSSKNKSTATNVSSESKSTATHLSSQNKSTATILSSENKSTATNLSGENILAVNKMFSENKSTATNLSGENKSTATNLSSESKSTTTNLSSESKSTTTNLSSESKSTTTNLSSESKSTATNSSNDNIMAVNKLSSENKSTVTNFSSENKSTTTSVSLENKSTVTNLSSESKSTETTPCGDSDTAIQYISVEKASNTSGHELALGAQDKMDSDGSAPDLCVHDSRIRHELRSQRWRPNSPENNSALIRENSFPSKTTLAISCQNSEPFSDGDDIVHDQDEKCAVKVYVSSCNVESEDSPADVDDHISSNERFRCSDRRNSVEHVYWTEAGDSTLQASSSRLSDQVYSDKSSVESLNRENSSEMPAACHHRKFIMPSREMHKPTRTTNVDVLGQSHLEIPVDIYTVPLWKPSGPESPQKKKKNKKKDDVAMRTVVISGPLSHFSIPVHRHVSQKLEGSESNHVSAISSSCGNVEPAELPSSDRVTSQGKPPTEDHRVGSGWMGTVRKILPFRKRSELNDKDNKHGGQPT